MKRTPAIFSRKTIHMANSYDSSLVNHKFRLNCSSLGEFTSEKGTQAPSGGKTKNKSISV